MVRCSLSRRLILAASFLASASFLVVSCSGTAVLGTEDPLACEAGHGCGSVICRCADETILLASLCEDEFCQGEGVCTRRCESGDHGTALDAVTAENEAARLAAPFCGTICKRLQIGGCELGCDPFFTGCESEVSCDPEREAFYACLANDAVLSCEEGAVAFTGCTGEALGFCSAAP